MSSVIDSVKSQLVNLTGASASLDTLELWDRYLISIGFTTGSLLDRMAKGAALAGVPLSHYIHYGPNGLISLGPELAPPPEDGPAWLLTGTNAPTADVDGFHFVGSSGGAAATFTSEGLFPDNVMFRIAFGIRNYSGAGNGRVLVYGNTANHLASTTAAGVPGNANGDFVVFRETAFTGANADEIRVQCQTGLCNFDIVNVSVKRVL